MAAKKKAKKAKKVKKDKKAVKSMRKPASAGLENANAAGKKRRTALGVSIGLREKLRKYQDTLSKKTGQQVTVEDCIWHLIRLATSRKRKAK